MHTHARIHTHAHAHTHTHSVFYGVAAEPRCGCGARGGVLCLIEGHPTCTAGHVTVPQPFSGSVRVTAWEGQAEHRPQGERRAREGVTRALRSPRAASSAHAPLPGVSDTFPTLSPSHGTSPHVTPCTARLMTGSVAFLLWKMSILRRRQDGRSK